MCWLWSDLLFSMTGAMAAHQSSGAVKYSPWVVYLTLLGQLCDSAPGVPELGELAGQGKCARRGPDRTSVTFPPDSLSWRACPTYITNRLLYRGQGCLSCLRSTRFPPVTPPSSIRFSLTAGTATTPPQHLIAPWGHAYVSHTEARPSILACRCQGWTDTPATLPSAAGRPRKTT